MFKPKTIRKAPANIPATPRSMGVKATNAPSNPNVAPIRVYESVFPAP